MNKLGGYKRLCKLLCRGLPKSCGRGARRTCSRKLNKLDDTISQLQAHVEDIQLNIKPESPPKERERKQNVKKPKIHYSC